MKPESCAHLIADLLDQFWAIWLSFWARLYPTSRVKRRTLLSKASSNFLNMEDNTCWRRRLRTLSTTFMARSMHALSALVSALNHTPFRSALALTLIISLRVRVVRFSLNMFLHFFSVFQSCTWLGCPLRCLGRLWPLLEQLFDLPFSCTLWILLPSRQTSGSPKTDILLRFLSIKVCSTRRYIAA